MMHVRNFDLTQNLFAQSFTAATSNNAVCYFFVLRGRAISHDTKTMEQVDERQRISGSLLAGRAGCSVWHKADITMVLKRCPLLGE
jgi:hypothetical protein